LNGKYPLTKRELELKALGTFTSVISSWMPVKEKRHFELSPKTVLLPVYDEASNYVGYKQKLITTGMSRKEVRNIWKKLPVPDPTKDLKWPEEQPNNKNNDQNKIQPCSRHAVKDACEQCLKGKKVISGTRKCDIPIQHGACSNCIVYQIFCLRHRYDACEQCFIKKESIKIKEIPKQKILVKEAKKIVNKEDKIRKIVEKRVQWAQNMDKNGYCWKKLFKQTMVKPNLSEWQPLSVLEKYWKSEQNKKPTFVNWEYHYDTKSIHIIDVTACPRANKEAYTTIQDFFEVGKTLNGSFVKVGGIQIIKHKIGNNQMHIEICFPKNSSVPRYKPKKQYAIMKNPTPDLLQRGKWYLFDIISYNPQDRSGKESTREGNFVRRAFKKFLRMYQKDRNCPIPQISVLYQEKLNQRVKDFILREKGKKLEEHQKIKIYRRDLDYIKDIDFETPIKKKFGKRNINIEDAQFLLNEVEYTSIIEQCARVKRRMQTRFRDCESIDLDRTKAKVQENMVNALTALHFIKNENYHLDSKGTEAQAYILESGAKGFGLFNTNKLKDSISNFRNVMAKLDRVLSPLEVPKPPPRPKVIATCDGCGKEFSNLSDAHSHVPACIIALNHKKGKKEKEKEIVKEIQQGNNKLEQVLIANKRDQQIVDRHPARKEKQRKIQKEKEAEEHRFLQAEERKKEKANTQTDIKQVMKTYGQVTRSDQTDALFKETNDPKSRKIAQVSPQVKKDLINKWQNFHDDEKEEKRSKMSYEQEKEHEAHMSEKVLDEIKRPKMKSLNDDLLYITEDGMTIDQAYDIVNNKYKVPKVLLETQREWYDKTSGQECISFKVETGHRCELCFKESLYVRNRCGRKNNLNGSPRKHHTLNGFTKDMMKDKYLRADEECTRIIAASMEENFPDVKACKEILTAQAIITARDQKISKKVVLKWPGFSHLINLYQVWEDLYNNDDEIKRNLDYERFKNKMFYIHGPWGTGKSYQIRRFAKPNHMIVCATRELVLEYIIKFAKKNKVHCNFKKGHDPYDEEITKWGMQNFGKTVPIIKTYEVACMTEIPSNSIVWVDECHLNSIGYAIKMETICQLNNRPIRAILFVGDHLQVKAVDFAHINPYNVPLKIVKDFIGDIKEQRKHLLNVTFRNAADTVVQMIKYFGYDPSMKTATGVARSFNEKVVEKEERDTDRLISHYNVVIEDLMANDAERRCITSHRSQGGEHNKTTFHECGKSPSSGHDVVAFTRHRKEIQIFCKSSTDRIDQWFEPPTDEEIASVMVDPKIVPRWGGFAELGLIPNDEDENSDDHNEVYEQLEVNGIKCTCRGTWQGRNGVIYAHHPGCDIDKAGLNTRLHEGAKIEIKSTGCHDNRKIQGVSCKTHDWIHKADFYNETEAREQFNSKAGFFCEHDNRATMIFQDGNQWAEVSKAITPIKIEACCANCEQPYEALIQITRSTDHEFLCNKCHKEDRNSKKSEVPEICPQCGHTNEDYNDVCNHGGFEHICECTNTWHHMRFNEQKSSNRFISGKTGYEKRNKEQKEHYSWESNCTKRAGYYMDHICAERCKQIERKTTKSAGKRTWISDYENQNWDHINAHFDFVSSGNDVYGYYPKQSKAGTFQAPYFLKFDAGFGEFKIMWNATSSTSLQVMSFLPNEPIHKVYPKLKGKVEKFKNLLLEKGIKLEAKDAKFEIDYDEVCAWI
jgi:hypothetical protein